MMVSSEGRVMAGPVHCEICGKLYTTSSIKTHKRLSHRIDKSAAEKVVDLFKDLSIDDQKKVIEKLISIIERDR